MDGELTVEGVVGVGADGADGADGEEGEPPEDFLEDLLLESPVFDFLEDFGVDDRNRALTTGLN